MLTRIDVMGHSGRSQMAALLRHRSEDAVQVASAGTQPREQVQPEVLAALGELGVETGDLYPKPLTDEVVSGADLVGVRTIRDDLARHFSDLLADLGIASPAAR